MKKYDPFLEHDLEFANELFYAPYFISSNLDGTNLLLADYMYTQYLEKNQHKTLEDLKK